MRKLTTRLTKERLSLKDQEQAMEKAEYMLEETSLRERERTIR
jgi:hypothetical protein